MRRFSVIYDSVKDQKLFVKMNTEKKNYTTRYRVSLFLTNIKAPRIYGCDIVMYIFQ
jgi:hypothetical protein